MISNTGIQLNQDKMAVTTDVPPANKYRRRAAGNYNIKTRDVHGDSRN